VRNVALRLKTVKGLALNQHAFFRTISVLMTQRDLCTRECTHFEVRRDQFPGDLILSLQILEKITLILTVMRRNRRGGNCQLVESWKRSWKYMSAREPVLMVMVGALVVV